MHARKEKFKDDLRAYPVNQAMQFAHIRQAPIAILRQSLFPPYLALLIGPALLVMTLETLWTMCMSP